MPEGGVTVYAKWRQVQYRVFLHPNAGTDSTLDWGSDDQAMNFRIAYGGKLSAPTGLRNDYEFIGWYLDENCTQLFSADAFVLNDTTVTSTYNKSVDMTDPMDKWGNVGSGAYNSDATGYNGGDRFWITRKLDLYAKWRAKLNGAKGIGVVYDAKSGTNAPTDTQLYLDNTDAVAQPASTAPDGQVFKYWVVQQWNGSEYVDTTETVFPGDSFTVLKANAKQEVNPNSTSDDDKYLYTVQLRAEYGEPEKPGTTSITWHSNTVDVDGNAITGATDKTETDGNLGINEAVGIKGRPDSYDEKYVFLGWAKEADAKTPWLIYDEAKDEFTTKIGDSMETVTKVAADLQPDATNQLYALWEVRKYNITVKKLVDGTPLNEGDAFTFNPTNFNNGEAFTLQNSAEKRVEGVEYGTKINVSEAALAGYDIKNITVQKTSDVTGQPETNDPESVNDNDEIEVKSDLLITYTNEVKKNTVTVKKVVVGSANDQNEEFDFAQTGMTGDDAFKLKHNDEKVYNDVRYNTAVTLSETVNDEFDTTITVKVGEGDETAITGVNTGSLTITDDTTITYTNTRKAQKVKVVKVGSDEDHKNALAGATFSLTGGDMNLTGLTSGEDGYLLASETSNVFELTSGAYTLTETAAPKGYVKRDDGIVLNVTSGGVALGGDYQNVKLSERDGDGVYTVTVMNPQAIDITAEKVWYASLDDNKAPVVVKLLRSYDGLATPEEIETFTLSANTNTALNWKKQFAGLPAAFMDADGDIKTYEYYLLEAGLNLGDQDNPAALSTYHLQAPKYYASTTNELPTNGWNGMEADNTHFTLNGASGTLYVGNCPGTNGTQMDVRKKWKRYSDSYGWADVADQPDVQPLRITVEVIRTATYNGTQTREDSLGTIVYDATTIHENNTNLYVEHESELWHIKIPESPGNDGVRQLPIDGLIVIDGVTYEASYSYTVREVGVALKNGEQTTDVTAQWDRTSFAESQTSLWLYNARKYDLTIIKNWNVKNLELTKAVQEIYFTVKQKHKDDTGDGTDIGAQLVANPAMFGLEDNDVATIDLNGGMDVIKMTPANADGSWSATQQLVIDYLWAYTNNGKGDNWTEVLYTVEEVAYKDASGVHLISELCAPAYSRKVRNNDWNIVDIPNGLQLGFDGETAVQVTNALGYKVDILKTNEDATPLKGAKFLLYGSADGETPNENPISDTEIVTGDNGVIELGMLDAGTYFLVETEAPAGYNLLPKPVKIVVNPKGSETKTVDSKAYPLKVTYAQYTSDGQPTTLSSSHEGITVTETMDETTKAVTYSYQIKVTNTSGAKLPSTGGEGTVPFTVGGAGLIALALWLLLKKRASEF